MGSISVPASTASVLSRPLQVPQFISLMVMVSVFFRIYSLASGVMVNCMACSSLTEGKRCTPAGMHSVYLGTPSSSQPRSA